VLDLPKRLLYRIGSVALLLWAVAAQAVPLDVAVVSGGEGGAYAEVVETLRAELGGDARITEVSWQQPDVPAQAEVVVAIGVKAFQAVAAGDVHQPVLGVLIPRSTFEKIIRQTARAQEGRHFSAVYLDQPLARQLELVRQVLPGSARVGAVFGPDSRQLRNALEAEAERVGIKLRAERVASDEDLYPALQRVLEDSDLLLALPDPLVFNSGTIQSIMLTGYRYRLPVIGFSVAYVKAGALAAVYSTPTQLAHQAAELLRQYRGELPPPQYPRYFNVNSNAHVARSLGIHLPDEAVLLEKMMRAERRP
jgi:hypothetical protein